MAYATLSDVEQHNTGRQPFGTQTKPNAGQVVDFLELTAAQLDGTLRAHGYQVPIATSATQAHKLLEHGNALGAAYMVETAAPTPGGDQRLQEARRLWESFLKAIATGNLELEAATRDQVTSRPRSHTAATAMFRVGMDH